MEDELVAVLGRIFQLTLYPVDLRSKFVYDLVLSNSVLDGVSFLHLKLSDAVAEANCYGIRKLGGEPTQGMTGLESHDRLPEVEFAKRRMRGTK